MIEKLLPLLLLAGHTRAAEVPAARFAVPMRFFADLLKIPVDPPDGKPTVHSSSEEDGVVIEDVSWPSIDGEVAPAFIVRPAKGSGRLPAGR